MSLVRLHIRVSPSGCVLSVTDMEHTTLTDWTHYTLDVDIPAYKADKPDAHLGTAEATLTEGETK